MPAQAKVVKQVITRATYLNVDGKPKKLKVGDTIESDKALAFAKPIDEKDAVKLEVATPKAK